MCEIRFSLSAKDGKLEKMFDCVPGGCRVEVVKEALRYFLSHVRDNKVESMYIDSTDLEEFKSDIKPNLFTLEDMMKLLDSQSIISQPVMPQQIQQHSVHQVNIQQEVPVVDEVEEKIEFDCDSDDNLLINEDMLDADF